MFISVMFWQPIYCIVQLGKHNSTQSGVKEDPLRQTHASAWDGISVLLTMVNDSLM